MNPKIALLTSAVVFSIVKSVDFIVVFRGLDGSRKEKVTGFKP